MTSGVWGAEESCDAGAGEDRAHLDLMGRVSPQTGLLGVQPPSSILSPLSPRLCPGASQCLGHSLSGHIFLISKGRIQSIAGLFYYCSKYFCLSLFFGAKGDKLGQRMSWGHPGHVPFPAPWESQACGPHFPTAESRLQGRLQAVLWLKADCCKPGVRQLGNTQGCPEVWGWSGCLSGRVCACGRPVMPSWGACHISSFAS